MVVPTLSNKAPLAAVETTTRFGLEGNYPNPFNPETVIRYSLRDESWVNLAIYDVAGRKVRTLIDGQQTAGNGLQITWDGRNDSGSQVASGIYIYRLQSNQSVASGKMLLTR